MPWFLRKAIRRFRALGHDGHSGAGDLLSRLRAKETERSPFQAETPPRARPGMHWGRPELVADIEFAEWTGAGQVRQASYKGLGEGKPARQVVAEHARVNRRRDSHNDLTRLSEHRQEPHTRHHQHHRDHPHQVDRVLGQTKRSEVVDGD